MTRFALVHDWFESVAGSERVVREMLQDFPNADVHSLVNHMSSSDAAAFDLPPVTTSFVQRLPFSRRAFRNYLPLMPLAIEQFDLTPYDVVISSSHAFAKGVVTNSEQVHISYVHTPIRYAWDMYHDYLRTAATSRVKSCVIRAVLHYIRMWDRSTANRPDYYIANSKFVAARIKKTYQRDATVIYPPVDVHRMTVEHKKEPFFLAAGRLVSYKRFDLLLDVFAALPDRQLVIIGSGPELEALRRRATDNVQLLGYQDDATLADYMRRASALIFAAVEDFGILPVEAQACGTPVIGIRRGGVAESVIHEETGFLAETQTADALVDAVETFSELPRNFFDADHIRTHAESFSAERFRREFSQYVHDAMKNHRALATSAYTNAASSTYAAPPPQSVANG